MSFLRAVASGYRHFGTIRGRARRPEFWWFHLYAVLVSIPVQLGFLLCWALAFEGSLSSPGDEAVINPDAVQWGWFTVAIGILLAYLVAVMVPAWTVGARRLHDAGMSAGWMLLIAVGLGIVPFIMCIVPGQRGSNRHGPDPSAMAATPAAALP